MQNSNYFRDYQKYRWFFTSSKKLVIGGKNAIQNEELLKILTSNNVSCIVAHTKAPGSPFAFALSNLKKLTKTDLYEIAVFTASFSKAWKECKNDAEVDFFLSSSLYKKPNMATGTWGVKEILSRITVPLKLTIAKQKGTLRAIPLKNDSFITILPGDIPKEEFVSKLEKYFSNSKQELLSALPSGKFKMSIKNNKKNEK